MNPRLTDRGRAIVVAAALGLLFAAVLGSAAAAAAAGCMLCLVAYAFALTLPRSRQLRGETIELAWWVEADEVSRRDRVVAGRPFQLRFFIRHFGDRAVRVVRFTLVSDAVETDVGERDMLLVVPPSGRIDHEIRCLCRAPGRAVLHGARVSVEGPLGLFETRLYFPNRLRLVALPARLLRSVRDRVVDDAKPLPRRSVRHRRDEGMDLHELRDLRPGDPFRRIAWKASARTGKLVVREPEREELGSLDIVLDASPTMREGVRGDRRIDRAVSVVLALADEALSRGQRVGFVAVDRRVIARVPSDARSDQRARIVDALVTALGCVDADRTVEDDGAVGRTVARYLRFQEGIDYLDPRVRDGVHLERLALHVVHRAKGHHEVHAPTAAGRIVRRYAEQMGIPLSPRSDRDVAARSTAIMQGLAEVAGPRVAPSRVVLVTDGRDVDFDGRLRSQLARLRRHGHGLEVVLVRTTLPRARELGLSVDSELALTHAEDDVARLRAVAVRLRARGIASAVEPDYPSARRVA